jgi:hypothetical protein
MVHRMSFCRGILAPDTRCLKRRQVSAVRGFYADCSRCCRGTPDDGFWLEEVLVATRHCRARSCLENPEPGRVGRYSTRTLKSTVRLLMVRSGCSATCARLAPIANSWPRFLTARLLKAGVGAIGACMSSSIASMSAYCRSITSRAFLPTNYRSSVARKKICPQRHSWLRQSFSSGPRRPRSRLRRQYAKY